jgi:hypothetical protein
MRSIYGVEGSLPPRRCLEFARQSSFRVPCHSERGIASPCEAIRSRRTPITRTLPSRIKDILTPTPGYAFSATSTQVSPAAEKSIACNSAGSFPQSHIRFCCPSTVSPETDRLPPNRMRFHAQAGNALSSNRPHRALPSRSPPQLRPSPHIS